MTEPNDSTQPRRVTDRVLALFTTVRAGEGADAILLMLAIFLLLTAYYIIKVVRESLILSGGGAELKSYTSAAQTVLFLFLIPVYSNFANRVNRMRLIGGSTLFFFVTLLMFYGLALANTPGLGIAFFVWVGIFNLLIVAQFWSFSNDVYTPEQGHRLFAILGFGQTLGAALGGVLSSLLIGPLGVYQLMLVAAALLAAYLALIWVVNRRISLRAGATSSGREEPMADRRGGLALVARDRYLLFIALLLLVLNFVNSNGEYILGRVVTGEATRLVGAGLTGGLAPDDFARRFIGSFYAGYFTWVNVLTVLIQMFIVGRVLKRYGVRVALFVLPIVSFTAYGIVAFLPSLALIRAAKIGENSLDYSLNNTTHYALFLPTPREVKYKAMAAIDTIFVRAGDLFSAGLVFAGTLIAMRVRDFALFNMALVLVWVMMAIGIVRRHRVLMRATEEQKNA